MHRFVIFLLLFVLPLQFALAGAVDAFEHAADLHSEHSHTAGTDITPDAVDVEGNDDGSPRCLNECGVCHFFHSLAFFGSLVQAMIMTSAADALSLSNAGHQNRVTAQRPERPKWSQFA